MGNNSVIGKELVGKRVVLSSERYKGDEAARTFLCKDGFGCYPGTIGSAIFGEFVSDGTSARINRYDIEKVLD